MGIIPPRSDPSAHTVQYLTTGKEWMGSPLLPGMFAMISGEQAARQAAIATAQQYRRPTRVLNHRSKVIAAYDADGNETSPQD